MPVENPTIAWDEAASPFRKVATIRIPAQTFDTPEQMTFCENLSYTPWHALPEHERVLVLLRKFYGFSYAEMAEMLAIPETTVKSRLHEAKVRLADHLGPRLDEGGQSWSAATSGGG